MWRNKDNHTMHKSAYFFLLGFLLVISSCSNGERDPVTDIAWDPFLDTLQHDTFRYFWEFTNPENGLVPDRAPTESFSSVAAVGFGLTVYPIGVERGYITREQAAERVLTTLRFFRDAPQSDHPSEATGYRGHFYHFLHMDSGFRYDRVELSTIDSALLIAGALFCGMYFDREDDDEEEIRAIADSLYRRVDWQWAQNNPPAISLGWHPESGFLPYDYRGYSEAMILYILALGSPTYPVDADAWDEWTSNYTWGSFYGYEHLNFGPMFGHQYSHLWIDFRDIRDEYMRETGIDYFENSRRAVYSQQTYAIDNPNGWRDYGENIWGLTACDGPADTVVVIDGVERKFDRYWARGVSVKYVNDDGTIAPTAAGASLPFAPEIVIPALKEMRDRYGDRLYTEYGFLDAFNPTYRVGEFEETGWFNKDYLGIDQGPIVIMIENHRNNFVWDLMRENEYIRKGLERAGFSGGWLE
jgi:hypothetical protein